MRQTEKEITAVNQAGMKKRFQMYGEKAVVLMKKSQKKGERK